MLLPRSRKKLLNFTKLLNPVFVSNEKELSQKNYIGDIGKKALEKRLF